MNSYNKTFDVLRQLDSFNLDFVRSDLELILKGQCEVLHSIYSSKIKLEEGEVFIETLILKIIYTSKSIIELSKGFEIQPLDIKKFQILDTSSLYILTRTIFESFLTLEYLYINNLKKDEKIFRFKMWRASGYMTRQYLKGSIEPELEEKLEREAKIIENLKTEIKESPYFKKLKNQDIWKLDKFGLPRTISWSHLINESKIKTKYLERSYKLYSNYAHSEYISMIQINENGLGKENELNKTNAALTLINVRIINSVVMMFLKNKFDCCAEVYKSLPDNLKTSVELWNDYSIKK